MIRVEQQASDPGQTRFLITDANGSRSAVVPSPYDTPVEGRPGENLMIGLDWYLEHYLEYPSEPTQHHAARVEAALLAWGQAAFRTLFGDLSAGDLSAGEQYPQLQIVSTEPAILFWPWEALADGAGNVVAAHWRIHRLTDTRTNAAAAGRRPRPASARALNVLLVTSRPEPNIIPFRSIAGPLVALASEPETPIVVDLLRPPTFEAFAARLRERPNHYDLVHFDGHGHYSLEQSAGGGEGETLGRRQSRGSLAFERAHDHGADHVAAFEFAKLLEECPVPVVVLNACQSAKHSPTEVEPIASVAAALVAGGVESVLAMSHSVSVTAARIFFGGFYRALAQRAPIDEAARAGRQALAKDEVRSSKLGPTALKDWLIPVVYQRPRPRDVDARATPDREGTPQPVRSATEAMGSSRHPAPTLEEAALGQDANVLALERALQLEPPAVLVHGLAGSGKTTLVTEFVAWNRRTSGLKKPCLWFDLHGEFDVTSALQAVAVALLGHETDHSDIDQTLSRLVTYLRREPQLIVLDGIFSTPAFGEVSPSSIAQRALLEQLLARLQGGRSKLLLTGRDHHVWLSPRLCTRLCVAPLDPANSVALAERVLARRNAPHALDLREITTSVRALRGNPGTIAVVVASVPSVRLLDIGKDPGVWLEAFKDLGSREDQGQGAASREERVVCALRRGIDALPAECLPVLGLLALHRDVAHPELLQEMAEAMGSNAATAQRTLESLTCSGLAVQPGDDFYFLHPLLPSYLRLQPKIRGSDEGATLLVRAFVECWAGTARDSLSDGESALDWVGFLEETLQVAASLADAFDMQREASALIQVLAARATETQNFDRAAELYGKLVQLGEAIGDAGMVAAAHHQLGLNEAQRGDRTAAQSHYQRSLELKEGDTVGVARSKYQLGCLARQQGDDARAEQLLLEAFELSSKIEEDGIAASSLQVLARMAFDRHDLDRAATMYESVIEMKERAPRNATLGSIYFQLGLLQQRRGNPDAARVCYQSSLDVSREFGSFEGEAKTLFQLGQLQRELGHLDQAEALLLQALDLDERHALKRSEGATCHELGYVAQERGDFAAARMWFERSRTLCVESEDEAGLRRALHHLGMVSEAQGDAVAAEEFHLQALELAMDRNQFHAASTSCSELGNLNAKRGRFAAAGLWIGRAIRLCRSTGDEQMLATLARNFIYYYCLAEAAPERPAMDTEWQSSGMPMELLLEPVAEANRAAELDDTLERLPDARAERVLMQLLAGLPRPTHLPKGPALRRLVEECVQGVGRRVGAEPVTDGVVARSALLILTGYDTLRERIKNILESEVSGETLEDLDTSELLIGVMSLAGLVAFDADERSWRRTFQAQLGPLGRAAAFVQAILDRGHGDPSFW